jgi:hypothetical protein
MPRPPRFGSFGSFCRPTAAGYAVRLGLLLAAVAAGAACRLHAGDPVAADIDHWTTMMRLRAANRGWAQIARTALPALANAREEERRGRRELALELLAGARVEIETGSYWLKDCSGKRFDESRFEAEWARLGGGALRDALGAPDPGALSGARPAAARAIAEAALPEVGAYYRASLDYGRSTTPQSGCYYLANAQALRRLVAFCRTVGGAFPIGRPPELRGLDAEIAGLEGELAAEFKPPAAVTNHGAFINAGSLLKEARELNAGGLRYGALLRYLQAAFAVRSLAPSPPAGPATAAPPPVDARTLGTRLTAMEARLAPDQVDHTIGRIWLQRAETYLQAGAPRGGALAAAAILDDVLPRYFAALGPAPPGPARQAAEVTVTLVRWPFT